MASEKRLIDAYALANEFLLMPGHYRKAEIDLIDSAPTVDAVEVVRCGVCRHCDTADCPMSGTPGRVSVSDFCSYGERREDHHGK